MELAEDKEKHAEEEDDMNEDSKANGDSDMDPESEEEQYPIRLQDSIKDPCIYICFHFIFHYFEFYCDKTEGYVLQKFIDHCGLNSRLSYSEWSRVL